MTTKVTDTVSHKTSQGDVIVTKGKLVLIPEFGAATGDLWREFETDKIVLHSTDEGDRQYKALIKPIIISETEKIEVGDFVICGDHQNLYQKIGSVSHVGNPFNFKNTIQINGNEDLHIDRYVLDYCKKILALPEHFTHKQIQAIVDGKMKDGDEVCVECEDHYPRYINQLKEEESYFHIKLNSDNHVTLHKVEVKESWSKGEVYRLIHNLIEDIEANNVKIPLDMNNWIERNV